MNTASPEAVVFLDRGVSVSVDQYETLTEIRGEDRVLEAEGKKRLSINEKANRLGVDPATAKYLFHMLDRHDRRIAENQRRDEWGKKKTPNSKMPRSPQEPPQLAGHRGPLGEKQWWGMRGYIDEKAIVAGEVAEMMAAQA